MQEQLISNITWSSDQSFCCLCHAYYFWFYYWLFLSCYFRAVAFSSFICFQCDYLSANLQIYKRMYNRLSFMHVAFKLYIRVYVCFVVYLYICICIFVHLLIFAYFYTRLCLCWSLLDCKKPSILQHWPIACNNLAHTNWASFKAGYEEFARSC